MCGDNLSHLKTVKRTSAAACAGMTFLLLSAILKWKRLQYRGSGKLMYLRSKSGREIDFIIEDETGLTPVEVKWTENPGPSDVRHIKTFLHENPGVKQGLSLPFFHHV